MDGEHTFAHEDAAAILPGTSACSNDKVNDAFLGTFECEYHIVYSAAYNVPMLLLDATWCSTGKPLSFEDITTLLLSRYDQDTEAALSGKRTYDAMLSQEEHPILSRPFYALHPCQTSAVMKTVILGARDVNDSGKEKESSHPRQCGPKTSGPKQEDEKEEKGSKKGEGKTRETDKGEKEEGGEEGEMQAEKQKSVVIPYLLSWLSVYGRVVKAPLPRSTNI
jgi:hypothetical protein